MSTTINGTLDERSVLAERRMDAMVAATVLIKHIDPGPSGYYLVLGEQVLAGPERKEFFAKKN